MRYVSGFVASVVVVGLIVALLPAPKASAGSYHWEAGAPMQNQDGEWVIYAEFKDGEGNVLDTVQTGTTGSKRKSKRASNELADSLNEAGSSFKWDPACEGAHFDC